MLLCYKVYHFPYDNPSIVVLPYDQGVLSIEISQGLDYKLTRDLRSVDTLRTSQIFRIVRKTSGYLNMINNRREWFNTIKE